LACDALPPQRTLTTSRRTSKSSSPLPPKALVFANEPTQLFNAGTRPHASPNRPLQQIHRDALHPRTLLRLQLDSGLGFYADFNPWFGDASTFTARSPIASDTARGDSATWFETRVAYRLAGITRLGNSPV
jgi:hypothetical protein